jgi:outer membrane protein OmpA-like peptidoglycan-associated protein
MRLTLLIILLLLREYSGYSQQYAIQKMWSECVDTNCIDFDKPKKGQFIQLHFYHELDNGQILLPESVALFDSIIQILKHQRIQAILIKVYSSNLGSAEYNIDLTQRKANMYKDYMILKK